MIEPAKLTRFDFDQSELTTFRYNFTAGMDWSDDMLTGFCS